MMSSRQHRKSARISELQTRKAVEARCQKEGKGKRKLLMKQDLKNKQDSSRNFGKQKKTRPAPDLTKSNAELEVREGTSFDVPNVVHLSSGTSIPDKEKLGLLLDRLKRRDSHKFFAEPVDGAEVKYYYDVIKEPMDFQTITNKLDRGSYKTLEEFERDISLVYNNAFVFNASDTIYYKEARAIKKLATELFSSLRSDPEKFGTKSSRRPGCQDGKELDFLASNPRQTYKPCTSSVDKIDSIMSQVYSSSKELKLVRENNCRYGESLMQFVKGFGPTAQRVAERKLERLNAEISNLQIVPSQAPDYEVPDFGYPGNPVGYQRNTADQGTTLERGSVNLYDVLREGIAQASSMMEALGNVWQRKIKSFDNQTTPSKRDIIVAPSLRIHGASASNEVSMASRGFNASSGFKDETIYAFEDWNKSNEPHYSSFTQMMQDAINDGPDQTMVVSSSSRTQEFGPPACVNPSFPWELLTTPGYGGSSRSPAPGPNVANRIQTMAEGRLPLLEEKGSREPKF